MNRNNLFFMTTGLTLAVALSGLTACASRTISPSGLTQTITLPSTSTAANSSTPTDDYSGMIGIQMPDLNNFLIVKYSPGGTTVWQDLIDIPDQPWNLPLSLDASGNAYILSPDFNIKYNSDGQQIYLNTFANSSFWASTSAVDGRGNIYLAGYSDAEQIILVKYDSAGKEAWGVHYQYPGSMVNDVAGIALDNSGNVYIVGVSSNSKDFNAGKPLILKYDSQGRLLWVVKDDGQMQGGPRAAPVVDAAGNVYATGLMLVSETKGINGLTVENYDYVTVKYDSQGKKQWERIYDGPYNGYDVPHDLKVDAAGDVIVTGESDGQTGRRDVATIKYDSNGNELWVSRYTGVLGNGGIGDGGTPDALSLDSRGNIYVCGRDFNVPSGQSYLVIKYDPSGRELWHATYDGTGQGGELREMFVDSQGNVYVAGMAMLDSQYATLDTIKYSPDGTRLWVASYSKTYSNGSLDKLMVDARGNVYVIGRVTDPDN